MKLAAARARLVRLQFTRPMRTARGEFRERESVMLELRDDDGVRGFGEAAPWPGFGTESAEQALALLLAAEPLLPGMDVEPGAWLDPGFLGEYEKRGETVSVDDRGRHTVQLKAIE